jgi:hypothetical protein
MPWNVQSDELWFFTNNSKNAMEFVFAVLSGKKALIRRSNLNSKTMFELEFENKRQELAAKLVQRSRKQTASLPFVYDVLQGQILQRAGSACCTSLSLSLVLSHSFHFCNVYLARAALC